jgi:3',5'-cyclic AMP phosphodiesterase CpdA
MAVVFWGADGVGDGVGSVHKAFLQWIRRQPAPALIINGGDVYGDGTPAEFEMFFQQMAGNLTNICETPGNHDWHTRARSPETGEIPAGYEAFWRRFPPPLSQQPIDTSKRGGARYEHFIDIEGWRLVFLDTGPCEDDDSPWPMGEASRMAWLRETIGTPGRAKIVFAHHSRLSRGKHGDIEEVDDLWRALFDGEGRPLVALTMGGHDHVVSIYGPRPQRDPSDRSVELARGIHVIVNGAGGRGHDVGFRGTRPDLFFDDDNYALTRITLVDSRTANIDILGFGRGKNPDPGIEPSVLRTLPIRL